MWIDILILSHLLTEPAHGYQIKQRVGRSIGYAQHLNNNVLYPALRRLEEAGAIEGELVPQKSTPPRRVYRLTDHGMDVLRGLLEEFEPEQAHDAGEFNTRVSYLHLLEPRDRIRILRTRLEAKQGLLEHLRGALATEGTAEGYPYVPRLLEHLIRQEEADVRFVEGLIREEEER